MLLLADNDVGGAVTALRYILEGREWGPYTALLDIHFTSFDEVGLRRDAPDPLVWQTCQRLSAVLLTANRAGGENSLDEVIRAHAGAGTLPVVTIADPQRLVRDRAYAESAAVWLLDYLDRMDSLLGTGRLFIP